MRPVLAASVAALLLLAGCNAGSVPSPSPSPSPEPSPTASPAASPTATPDAPTPASDDASGSLDADAFSQKRAFDHVRALAGDIGSRPAGADGERDAARYLRDQLQGFGYEVELRPFTFDVFSDAGSNLQILSPQQDSPAVHPLRPSADGVAEGRLVDAGLGAPEEFPEDTAGKIALIRRGVLFFSDKVANAAAAGAAGVIIYNNEAGLFAGDLSGPSAIPAVSMSRQDGQDLLTTMERGPVVVRLEVRTRSGPQDSQNVVARPPQGECRVLAGGHYDSVPAGPGANDNASGTAAVVEIARVLASDGQLDDVCFVLFGAEEVGLIGSFRFVERLSGEEEETLEAMVNLDMVSVGDMLLLSGLASVTDIAAAEAEERGLDFTVDNSGGFGGSDHAPFLQAGVPAIFFHSFFETAADDPNYHSAGDTAANVNPDRLAEVGSTALALIETLLAGR